MKLFNRVITVILIFIVIISFFSTPCYATAELTEQQQAYLRRYVITYVTEGSNPPSGRGTWFIYDQGHNKEKTYNNEASSSGSRIIAEGQYAEGYANRIAYCCASFCAVMLHQALGAPLLEKDGPVNIRATSFFNPNKNDAFSKVDSEEYLQPGDVIIGTGYRWHAMLYIGMDHETGKHQIAQTGGKNFLKITDIEEAPVNEKITVATLKKLGGKIAFNGISIDKYGEVSRINPDILPTEWDIEMPIEIVWPDGSITEDDGQLILTSYSGLGELWYQGTAELDYEGVEETWFETLVNSLGDILDYIVGLVTYALRLPVIGAAYIAENIMNWILQIFSKTGTLEVITLEDIIFNRVPLLNINLVSELPQHELSQEGQDIIQFLHSSILTWYYIFRYVVIIGMLLGLIFMGIKLAISSIAEEKAKYKRMLLDWLVSFIIVFIIHFYVVIIINANEFVIGIFEKQIIQNSTNSDVLLTTGSFFNKIRSMMYSIKLTEGWLGVVAYMVLIYYTIKFAIKYLIRMFNIYILILLSPLVAMSYSFDKIKDGKSQSLKKWMKELGFGVFVQSIHVLIYTMFITLIISQIETTNILSFGFSLILMCVTFNFMEKAENLFESIFNIKSDSITSTNVTPDDVVKKITSATAVRGWISGYGVIAIEAYKRVKPVLTLTVQKTGIDKVNKSVKAIYNQEKYGDDEYSEDDEEIKKEKAKIKAQETKQKEQRKEMLKQVKEIMTDFVKAVPALAESPMTSITLLLSGVVGIKKHSLTVKKYKSDAKLNSKVDMYETVKLLNQKKQIQRKIGELDSSLRNNPDSIIGRGENPYASLEEQEKSKQANIILIDAMKAELDRIDDSIVEQSVDEIIIEDDGKIDGTTVERIAERVREKSKAKGKKGEINQIQLEESIKIALVRKNSSKSIKSKADSDIMFEIKKEKEKLKEELEEIVDTALTPEKAEEELTTYIQEKSQKNAFLSGISESEINDLISGALERKRKETSSEYTADVPEVRREKQKLTRKLEAIASTSKMSAGATKENLERELRSTLEKHIRKEMKKNAALSGMKKNEINEMISAALGNERSILNQRYGEKRKSTSNESTNLNSEELSRLQGECAPIMEAVRELRQVETKLTQHSIKSRSNIGSILQAREKAAQRSNVPKRTSNVPKAKRNSNEKQSQKYRGNERKKKNSQDDKTNQKKNNTKINFKI